MLYYVHQGMLIAKSLLRDLCSALGPYCTNCIGAKLSVFSDTDAYIDIFYLHVVEVERGTNSLHRPLKLHVTYYLSYSQLRAFIFYNGLQL